MATATGSASNFSKKKAASHNSINITSLLSWISVFMVVFIFWSAIIFVCEKDYVPHAIAKIEHKEKHFMASHKILQKRFTGFYNLVS